MASKIFVLAHKNENICKQNTLSQLEEIFVSFKYFF